jgi:hypothetical protein
VSMTVDQIISLAASVGACLAAVATFLTVWQIAKQRKASYKPELVLGSGEFEAQPHLQYSGFPNDWRHLEPKLTSGVTTISSEPNVFGLPLANIGLGAARNILISWKFAIEDAVTKVGKYAKEADFDNYLSFDRGILRMQSPLISSFWINQKIEAMDYVLPASIEGAVVRLRLPDAYVLLVSAAVSLSSSSKIKALGSRPELLEAPALSVTLAYEDIAGKKHSGSFDVDVDIRGVMNTNKFAGYVETRRRR